MYVMRLKLLFITIIIISVVFLILNFEKNIKIEEYLDKRTSQFKIIYESHYDQFLDKSKIIFDIVVNKKEVIEIYEKLQTASEKEKNILREKLYKLLQNDYNKFTSIKLKQLHFHLSSNESFLRFHKSSVYGDNLIGIRQTVEYVNRYGKSINGFEAGKIYSGYRFVYPLKDKSNKHLGSVEVSFDVSIFTEEFMGHFKVVSNYHLKKEIIDKKLLNSEKSLYYRQSPISGYYIEKHNNKTVYDNINTLKASKLIISKALKSINKGKAISLLDNESNIIVTFLPIKNPVSSEVVAILTIKSNTDFIENKTINTYFIFTIISLFIIVIVVIVYLWARHKNEEKKRLTLKVRSKTNQLREQNERTNLILDSQTSIVIVSDGKKVSRFNQIFFEIFGYKNINDFNSKYNCICELFIEKKDTPHIMPIMDGMNWTEYIAINYELLHITYMLDKHGDERVYNVKVNNNIFENEYLIVLTDITELLSLKNNLQERIEKEVEATKKEGLQHFEASKIASMGEMLENIAHQWRQPLSQINSAVYNLDDILFKNKIQNLEIETKLVEIESLTQYMSNTINDFKNFYSKKQESVMFSLEDVLLKTINIIKPTLNSYDILIEYDMISDAKLVGFPSELQQAVLVVLNNAKDAFLSNKTDKAKINIITKEDDKHYIISICNNAGRIDENILDKVFEPYFTTKHKAQGTGLGLYISRMMIESTNGTINLENTDDGVCFLINLSKG